MSGKTRIYIACSLDGFIAGLDDDLSWLPTGNDASGATDDGALDYADFMRDVGAMLMGRRTYDVVQGFDCEWPYGNTPVCVATHRPLKNAPETVTAVGGTITEIVAQAHGRAAGKDVYLDGGALIRDALDAGLVDELVVTWVPIVLGQGLTLFGGTRQRHSFELKHVCRYAGLAQMHLSAKSSPT